MAVSINLLPQERQTQLKDKRNRSLSIGLALLVNGGLIGLAVVLFVITQAQSLALSRMQSDIDDKIQQFQSTPNVQEMLTLQQNLKSVPRLYANRKIVTRFIGVVESVAPNSGLTLSSLTFNESGQLEVNGQAATMALVAKLVRAVEASKLEDAPNFSGVKVAGISGQPGDYNFSLSATVSAGATAAGGGQ